MADFEPLVGNFVMVVQLLINCLINIYSIPLDSVPVHSGGQFQSQFLETQSILVLESPVRSQLMVPRATRDHQS